jgi:cation transport protein ChaC
MPRDKHCWSFRNTAFDCGVLAPRHAVPRLKTVNKTEEQASEPRTSLPTGTLAAPPALGLGITRASLADGSALAAIRASAPASVQLRSEPELLQSLAETLQGHDLEDGLYVFGYGSLMWNPAFLYQEALAATVHGWSRKFCLWLYLARGSLEAPGLMLSLDRGGVCRGMVFRIPAAMVQEELQLLWRREMLSGAYQARWVTATVAGQAVKALTFVINRRHERYARHLSDEQIAHYIATGTGTLGTCQDYFDATVTKLEALGIRDAAMERIRSAVARRVSGASVAGYRP